MTPPRGGPGRGGGGEEGCRRRWARGRGGHERVRTARRPPGGRGCGAAEEQSTWRFRKCHMAISEIATSFFFGGEGGTVFGFHRLTGRPKISPKLAPLAPLLLVQEWRSAGAVRRERRRARACWESPVISRCLAGPIAAAHRALPCSVGQSQRCERKGLI
jgi:hypothetical protein